MLTELETPPGELSRRLVGAVVGLLTLLLGAIGGGLLVVLAGGMVAAGSELAGRPLRFSGGQVLLTLGPVFLLGAGLSAAALWSRSGTPWRGVVVCLGPVLAAGATAFSPLPALLPPSLAAALVALAAASLAGAALVPDHARHEG